MLDLATLIPHIVTLMTGYMTYRAAVETANKESKEEPTPSAEAKQGEQALATVQKGVAQHGGTREQKVLANFTDDPEYNQDGLQRMLTDLAQRSPAFAQHLQTVTEQANIQTGQVQGTVNVRGEAKVYGPTTGVNTGSISYTYNSKDNE